MSEVVANRTGGGRDRRQPRDGRPPPRPWRRRARRRAGRPGPPGPVMGAATGSRTRAARPRRCDDVSDEAAIGRLFEGRRDRGSRACWLRGGGADARAVRRTTSEMQDARGQPRRVPSALSRGVHRGPPPGRAGSSRSPRCRRVRHGRVPWGWPRPRVEVRGHRPHRGGRGRGQGARHQHDPPSPGAVDTEMLRRANPALVGWDPQHVAEPIVALLEQPCGRR